MRTVNFQARLAAGDAGVGPTSSRRRRGVRRRHGERWYEGMLHYYRGVAAFTVGNVAEAQSRSERALEAFAASGDLWGIVNASETLGHSLAAVGDYDGAMAVLRARARRRGARPARGGGAAPLSLRPVAPARRRLGGCDEAVRRVRAARGARVAVPSLARRDGRGALARRREATRTTPLDLFGRRSRRSSARRSPSGLDNRAVRVAMVVTLRELGISPSSGATRRTRVRLQEESLAWARRVGEPRLLARTLEGVAGALSLGERADEAARLLGARRGTARRGARPAPGAEREDVMRVADRLRDRLGDERFEAELARGRAEFVPQARP